MKSCVVVWLNVTTAWLLKTLLASVERVTLKAGLSNVVKAEWGWSLAVSTPSEKDWLYPKGTANIAHNRVNKVIFFMIFILIKVINANLQLIRYKSKVHFFIFL